MTETTPTKEKPELSPKTGAGPKNNLWYKTAILYEVHVRAFQDSNGDGTGDFPGLTSKLDYLRDLGVTAIWILPFYPSPLKDDGYDIADYYSVNPQYGTLADFKTLLREAHRRDLKIITELVLNHTSDRHPWFQRSRRAKPGSRWRDYYVWSDTPDKYKGTRIIFKDTEISNWTWDPVANAYYWHRFYSHQPDLNFDHEPVREEMFNVLDFWMNLGVDGVRLDAVPYLYEREGTSCENLPETHAFLKRVRHHVDTKYGDRMLLAEANQWPDDAVAYFGSGQGDECHMAFHFPLMPRLFMSLRMEDRVPIVDILQQTPAIPETAQWALFLRNHDELTLEMVTDEERDYMYRTYAQIHQARLNLGIRRRLAPLLGNDRKRIELLCALLFSLPGAPVIYYGDEIGMGENIFLGDRDGVRTPMQWSADKNAGFSRANPQSLYLPINLDPENHYEAVNVEVQEQNRHSLLWWMRQLIGLRKRWKAFSLGTLEFLAPENRKVLAFIRQHENECVLAVCNLSRFVQPVKLDLTAFIGRTPVELFGRTEFPAITDQPYFLTLSPHAFYWFSIEAKPDAEGKSEVPPIGPESRPLLEVNEDWTEVFESTSRAQLEGALLDWLPSRRWFNGQARYIKSVVILESIPIPMPSEKAFLLLVQVEHVQSETEVYLVPFACAVGEKADAVTRDAAPLVIARLNTRANAQAGVLYDAIANKDFCTALLQLMAYKRGIVAGHGRLEASHTSYLRQMRRDGALNLEPVVSKAELANSLIIYGDRLALKLFRRLDSGMNPDLEIGRFIAQGKADWTPHLAGALEFFSGRDEAWTLGILSSFIPQCKTGWDYTLDALGRFYEREQALPAEKRQPPKLPAASAVELSTRDLPEEVAEKIGAYLQDARTLGHRAALMHMTLAADDEDPNFRPEPWTPYAQRGLFQSMRNLTRQNFQALAQELKTLPPEVQADAQKVIALEERLLQRFRRLYEGRIDAVRIRIHGDFHLGQVLHTGKDFLIIDFEGEPAIPLSQRRLKWSPLRDVAAMVLSFHYAAQVALMRLAEHGSLHEAQTETGQEWARFWSTAVGAAFIKAYMEGAHGAPFMPANESGWQILLEAELLRNAVYQVGYELNHRRQLVRIPLQAILGLMNPGEK
jgi:maltose alpha-D-glucosyltransferase/alpha-amylase